MNFGVVGNVGSEGKSSRGAVHDSRHHKGEGSTGGVWCSRLFIDLWCAIRYEQIGARTCAYTRGVLRLGSLFDKQGSTLPRTAFARMVE